MLKAILIGNLGGDPELRYSPDGRAFLRMNVASNGRTKNRSGEWVDETTWVRVTVFGQQAERLSQHLRKGSRIFADGRLDARPWADNQGQVRAGLEIIANDVQNLSPRDDDSEGPGRKAGDSQAPGPGADSEPRRMPAMAGAVGYQARVEDGLEDVPF